MKICEIFEGIQGEGRYAGTPCLFIRVSGCTRKCEWCDTTYHSEGKEVTVGDILDRIENSDVDVIVWTGGEPTLYPAILDIVKSTETTYKHHLETNGDLLFDPPFIFKVFTLKLFDYVCVSPKDRKTAIQASKRITSEFSNRYDIKVVTDLETNKDLIPYATMLMPLTTGDKKEDLKIAKKVWQYCIKHKIKFCPRLHIVYEQK